MRKARLSVLGLYRADPTLFDTMQLPFTADRQTVTAAILAECAELEVLYPEPATMKELIGIWSKAEAPTWNRVAEAEAATWNPIENYDRYVDATETSAGKTVNSGKDNISGTDTSTNSGVDTTTEKVAGYDSADVEVKSQLEVEHGLEVASADSHTTNYGHVVDGSQQTHTVEHVHGNIGVTTASQMLKELVELAPEINLTNYITKSFRERFCLMVW